MAYILDNSFDDSYDVIIIGGGASGSGIALDAVLRGYKTLLLEKNDFGSGTSSKSTKLIHGGVRYLEKAVMHADTSQYHLVKEALQERSYFLDNAPHLAHPITLLTPIYKWFEIPYIYSGLYLYDYISGEKSLGKSNFVFKEDIFTSHPRIKHEHLCGGVQYFDGSFNDARMVIALLQTAQSLGAVVKNYHEVKRFKYCDKKLSGVIVEDNIHHKVHELNASCIINATGVYADDIRHLDDVRSEKILNISSGVHIIVNKKFLNIQEGILIPKTKDGRVVFVLPWQGACLIGTTDNMQSSNSNITVTKEEIEYLLEETNHYFDTTIQAKDVLSSWKGLRPLIKQKNTTTCELIREHQIYRSSSNLISIAGGKWTTYRKMAEEVLDFAIKSEILSFKKECETKKFKVIGSQTTLPMKSEETRFGTYKMLLQLYGDQTPLVLKMAQEEHGFELMNKHYLYIKAQIIYSIRHEFVCKPLDFLSRRIPLLLLNIQEALNTLEYVTTIIAKELKWSRKRYLDEYNEAKLMIEERRF